MTSATQEELEVRCADCGWQWIAAYLPMSIRDACKIMRTSHCPRCAAGPRRIFCFWNHRDPPKPRIPWESRT